MSLDLGMVIGRVGLDTRQFDADYVRTEKRFANLGRAASSSAGGVRRLDTSLAATNAEMTKAATTADRAAGATVASGRAADKAAASKAREAAASEKAAAAQARGFRAATVLGATMQRVSGESLKVQIATLRVAAARERLTMLEQSGTASTRALLLAQAGLISSQRSLALAQKEAAAAQRESTVAATGWRSGMAGTLKMARDLGLMFGAFEAVHKVIEITKEANQFDASMTRIRTLTSASTDEMNGMREALLGMSGQVAQSPDELATSLYHMFAIGLRGKDALDAVKIASEGAAIGNAKLEDTTNALTSTIASGIDKGQSFSETMNDLLTIVGSGDMSLQQLNEALGTGVLAKVAGYGVTIKDVGAALASFGDQNIRGADAATALRMVVESLAKPSAGGAAALSNIGLAAKDLRKDMQSGGLNKAVADLDAHLRASGVTGKRVGGVLLDIFSKKGSQGVNLIVQALERFRSKYHELNDGALTLRQRWDLATHTAQFGFRALGHEAEAAGIAVASKMAPALSVTARLLAGGLRGAITVATAAVQPFIAVWHAGAAVFRFVAGQLSMIGHFLSPFVATLKAVGGPLADLKVLGGALKGVGGAALAMFAAFKGYQLARAAILAIVDGAQLLAGRTVSGFLAAQTAVSNFATVTGLSSAKAEADALAVTAAQRTEAAQVASAKAMEAEAYAQAMLASGTATEAMVTNSQAAALAAREQAVAATAAAAETVVAADSAAAGVAEAGAVARVGWSSMLGPLAAVGLGIGLLVGMFQKSGSASREAEESTKAYVDALKAGGTAAQMRAAVLDTVTKKLSDNGAADALVALNKGQKANATTGREMVAAITQRGSALDALKTKLQGIVKAETTWQTAGSGDMPASIKKVSERGQAAQKLIDQLTMQADALTSAQTKEIANFKAFGKVVTPIQSVAKATGLSNDAIQVYAGMVGIAATKNNNFGGSAAGVVAAVTKVKQAYESATQSGSEYLAALQTFAKSPGTAADRAAIIGATLKAANGDALSYAAAINGAATADRQFFTNIKENADNAKMSTQQYLASLIDLKTGTINYRSAAAGPLISDLQGIQSAAMNAAQAAYQHARATMNGKQAADAAYQVYVTRTRNQFIDTKGNLTEQARQMGLNRRQARVLANTYFGMPKRVKTLIEQQGANPIVDVLNQIGKQLSYLTGHPWNIPVSETITIRTRDLTRNPGKYGGPGAAGNLTGLGLNVPGRLGADGKPLHVKADGGLIRGPGTGTSDSVPIRASNGEFVVRAAQTAKHLPLLHAINEGRQGFARGGLVGNAASIAAMLRSLLGAGRNQIAGILGNLKIESGFDPTAYNSDGGSYGIAQWLGPRLAALRAFAAQHHTGAANLRTQTMFLARELRQGGYFRHIAGMNDPAQIAGWLDANFERSDGSARGSRMSAAAGYARAMRTGGIPGASAAVGQVHRVSDGWTFPGSTTHYSTRRAAENARRRAMSRSASTTKQDAQSAVQSAIGAIGQAPSGPRIDLSQLGIRRVSSQIDAAQNLLQRKFAAGLLTRAQYERARGQITALAKDANRQLGALRMRIRTGDLRAIRNALKGTAADVRGAFSTMLSDSVRAGVSPQVLAVMRSAETRMLRNQARLAKERGRLGQMREYGVGVVDTLRGSQDMSQAGSIADLHDTLVGATGTNTAFDKGMTGLRSRVKDKGLQAWIANLAASGDTTTLQTLFGASRGELAGIGKDVARYQGSLSAAGSAATTFKFGESYAHQRSDVDKLIDQRSDLTDALASVVAVLPQIARRPQVLEIDGHQLTVRTLSDPAFERWAAGLLAKIKHTNRRGRNHR